MRWLVSPAVGDPFSSTSWAVWFYFRGEIALEAAAVYPVFTLVGGPGEAGDGSRPLRWVDVVVADDAYPHPCVPVLSIAAAARVGA